MYPARMAKMSANVSKLSPKQEQAIPGPGDESGRRQCRSRRWNRPEDLVPMDERASVRQGLSEGAPKRMRARHAALATGVGAAVSSILKIMVDPHGAKAIEIEDIEARVAELERAA